jgi:hypothetical protein
LLVAARGVCGLVDRNWWLAMKSVVGGAGGEGRVVVVVVVIVEVVAE